MLRFRSALLALTFVPVAVRAQTPDLQFTQNPANQHWYGITYAPTSWHNGVLAANAARGTLAAITSSAEQTWVQTAFAPYQQWRYWIGLNDVATEGQFVWSNGESVGYTNWIPGEPNNGNGVEDAVEIVPMQPGNPWKWNDFNPAIATTTKPLVEVDGLPRVGWTLPTSLTVGTNPAFPAVADLNNDGREDVVVPNAGSASVQILLGSASNSLVAGATQAVPTGPTSAAIGDFDDDGNLDWAVACLASMRVHVRYGDGLGGFPVSHEVVLNGKGHGLEAADFDGDGMTDLAVTTVDSIDRLQILRAAPGRTFHPAVLYATGSRPLHVTAGDLEGDGDVDLVVANELSDDISVFRNLGNGAFTSTALFARGDAPRRIALVDVDLDGYLDMAVPSFGDGFVRIIAGLPSGGFAPATTLAGGVQPTWTTVADLNGDGELDLVTAGSGTHEVLVQDLIFGGGFWKLSSLQAGASIVAVVPVDLNGDGRKDLVATGYGAARVLQFTKLSRDCNGNTRDDDLDITLGGSTDCNGNLEPDECDLAVPAAFDCDANGLLDACEILANAALDLDTDGTLDECEFAGIAYCFGDGTGAACPCDPGQAGAPGAGCMNSLGNSGRLVAVGNPSVANDSVSLRASGLLVTTTGLFFQGNAWQQGGLGALNGDGLVCVSQFVVRMEIRACQNSQMAFGRDVPGDPEISVDGNVPPAGGTRYYQVWYRDPPLFCTSSTFNFTNGVRIIWTP